MTIDDRLRDYASRWNAAVSVPPAATTETPPEYDSAFVIGPVVGKSRGRVRLVLCAAVVVLAMAAGGAAAAVLLHRGGPVPAAALADPAAYPAGTVEQATPAGQLIPADERVAAADVGGPLLAGASWSLSSQAGHIVVVSAWGSWCGPCQQFAPSLDALARPGVSVVGFAIRETDVATVRRFVASADITYPVVNDSDGAVIANLAPPLSAVGVPLTFLIDRLGGIAAVYVGSTARSSLDGAVAQLLTE